jgi:rod shape-determining protein MreD
MSTILSIPVLTVLVMLQSAVVSRVHLLNGTADLVLLALVAWAMQERVDNAWVWGLVGGILASLTTSLPAGVLIVSYLITVGLALLLRQRGWRIPLLGMFLITFLGTLITQGFSMLAILLSGTPLPILESLNIVILPSLLLNLLLVIPIQVILGDLANWLYPEEVEV